VYQATPCTHPVSTRAAAPSSTTTRFAAAEIQSSVGRSGPPAHTGGFEAHRSLSFVLEDRRDRLDGLDLSRLSRVKPASDDEREASRLQLAVRTTEVLGNVLSGPECALSMGAREVEEVALAVGPRKSADVAEVGALR
jgi:hypothetical protein